MDILDPTAENHPPLPMVEMNEAVTPYTRRYVEFIARRKRQIISAWAIAFVLCAIVAKMFLGSVVLVYNPPRNTPGDDALTVLRGMFPQSDHTNDIYLVMTTSDRTPILIDYYDETEQFVKEISSTVVHWAKVKLHPTTNYQPMNYFLLKELHADVLSLQVLDDIANPENATAMIALFHMQSGFPQGSQEGNKLANFVDGEIKRLSSKYLKHTPIVVKATGMIVFCRDMLEGTEKDMLKMDSLSFPFALLILGIMLQSVRLLLIPIMSMILTIVCAFSFMYPLAVITDVIAVAPSTMMSVAVAFSIDYSLFLLTRFREETSKGTRLYEAIELMVDTAGHTIMVSGATIAICWLGLLCFPVPLLSTIGLGAGLTVVVTFLVNITLAPALLLTFGPFFSDFSNYGLNGFYLYEKWKLLKKRQHVALPDPNSFDNNENLLGAPTLCDYRSPCAVDAFGRRHLMSPIAANSELSPGFLSPSLDVDGAVVGEIASPAFGQFDPHDEVRFLEHHSRWYKLGLVLFGTKIRAACCIVLGCALILPLTRTALSFHHSQDVKTFAPAHAEGAEAARILEDRFGIGRLSPYQLVIEPDSDTLVLSDKFFSHVRQVVYEKILPLKYKNIPAILPEGVSGMMMLDGYNISFTPFDVPHDKSIVGCVSSTVQEALAICTSHRCSNELTRCHRERRCQNELQCIEDANGDAKKIAVCLSTRNFNNSAAVELGTCILEKCMEDPFGDKLVSSSSNNRNLDERPGLDCPSVMLNFARGMNGLVPAATIVTLTLNINVFGADGEQWLDDARRILKEQSEIDNFAYYLAGGDVAGHDTVDTVYRLFPTVFGIILCMVFVLVGVSYKSVLVPLRAVFTICLTLILVYGLGVLTFEHGMLEWTHFHGFINPVHDSLTWLIPALIAPIAIGLGLDYDIFLLTRIYEYRQAGFSTRDSIMCGLAQTGGVITAAGVIMFFAFFGLSLSASPALNQLSFFLVVAVLSDTFVIRTILVPSAMLLLGESNWWPWIPATLDY